MKYILIILLYLLIINIITTIRLIKSDEYEISQRVIQTLLIWLLPLIGIFMVSHFLNDNPIVVKDNWIKYFIIKILLIPFLIKVIKLPKGHYNDISSSNYMTTADASFSSFGSGGD